LPNNCRKFGDWSRLLQSHCEKLIGPGYGNLIIVGKRFSRYTYIDADTEDTRVGNKGISMTKLLERAFAEASRLPVAEQDLLASRVLAELGEEDEFDRAIAASADKLVSLANAALAEHRAGQTQELDPDRA
ncbi:MAG: hypothetical protein WAU84_13845, partial [Thermoguttaceae bacterium]